MHRALPAVLLALAVPCAAFQDTMRVSTDLYPVHAIVERAGERWLCLRIVDDATGSPVAGARLFLVPEKEAPLAGVFWSSREATSDADGFVRARVDDVAWNVLVVRANGYAVASRSGPGEPIWRLAAPQDVPVLVRDWRGHPVSNATIGFCGSCGHGPDLVNATSDADGIAILRGIDPHNDIADLYCQARGLELGYQSIEWRPGDAPFEFVCESSTPLTGTLLDGAGKPIAGAFVGVPDVHRGPWAETRADGTFEVLGAPEGSSPAARIGEREVWFPRSATFPVVLRAPDADAVDPHNGSVDGPAAEDPPTIATTRIAVRADEAEGEVSSVSPSLGWNSAVDGLVDVPATGPFVLHVGARRFPYASADDLPPQPIALADFAPTIVRGTVVDASGTAVSARASLRVGDDESAASVDAPTGSFELPLRRTGTVLLEITPDERTDLRARLVYVALPARGDAAHVELGRIVLASEPRLRVLDARGAPLVDSVVRFGRPGYFEVGGEPRFTLDEHGGWTGPDLRAGDWVDVDALVVDDADRITVPFRTVLTGDGPWTITPPNGALRLVVRGAVTAYALVADQVFEVGTTSAWSGLAPGPLHMWISAPDRRTAIVTTTVPETGVKTIDVELAPL